MKKIREFQKPPIDLLEDPKEPTHKESKSLRDQSAILEQTLSDFGVHGEVINLSIGPIVTTFEYEPRPGTKISKIVNLANDLSLTLRTENIRIVAPIPGKAVIGVEVPNLIRKTVHLKEIIASNGFESSKSKLVLSLGKDVFGKPVVAELDKMPHLLIAGATGSGKSVSLNAMICGFLYKSSPEELRFIIIDPKQIEFSIYNGIPHLITPVIKDTQKATRALFWTVREMNVRYRLLSKTNTKNIDQYNLLPRRNRLPYIVIIIDELADLMMTAPKEVEAALARLAQMARSSGIHLILSTQRASVNVLTGIIKANFPTRISFQVASKIDSRIILDVNGAENLLGRGDMLFLPPGTAKIQRIHGAYISETEMIKITEFLKDRIEKPIEYDPAIITMSIPSDRATGKSKKISYFEREEFDEEDPPYFEKGYPLTIYIIEIIILSIFIAIFL